MRSSNIAKYRQGVMIGSPVLNTVDVVWMYKVFETLRSSFLN
jgi:hypothetical protein